jgi:hypothetical protein
MKHTFFKKLLIGFTLTSVIAVSCSKKIDEAYLNPNADVKVPPEQLLPGILASMVGNGAGHGSSNDNRFAGRYVQYWHANSAGTQADAYDMMGGTNTVSDNAASIWRAHYYDLGQNLMRMIDWAAEEKKWDYVGVGQAIFAWSWLTLGDYHGEVILKEAFNTSLITFKYDEPQEVYTYVRQLCHTALANLNKTGDGVSPANLAKGDQYFYGGDVNKWKKFVYGVLARSFNHLSNKTSYNADSVIAYANLAITSNADNATLKYAQTISANSNFYGPLRGNVGTLRQAAFSVNLMNGTNPHPAFNGVVDPRRWYLLRTNPNGGFVGLEPNRGNAGITNANDRPENFWGGTSATTTSPANDAACRFIFRNAAEFPVMTASEIQFMKAEAAFKKGDKATAVAAFRLGVSLHFDMLTDKYNVNIPAGNEITPATKAAYMASSAVPADPLVLTLSHIMLQKYIALWGYNALETWVDMRRYHYDEDVDAGTGLKVYTGFTPPSGINMWVDNGGKKVYRVRPRYNSEYVWNLNELIRIGADKLDYHTKETWFSQK